MATPTSPTINSLNASQMGKIQPNVQYIWDDVANVFRAATVSDVAGTSITTTTIPGEEVAAEAVRQVPSDIWRCGFAGTGAGVVSAEMSALNVGAGMSVSQAASNLLITTGTTANSETLLISNRAFTSGMISRAKITLSQRIVNQAFGVWMADLVGSGLAYTTDGTGLNITINIPGTALTAANIGQTMNIGAISGTGVAGRYAITAVSGNAITFSPIFSATWTRSTTTATATLVGGGGHEIIIGQAGAVTNSSDTAAIVNGAVTAAAATGTTFTFTCLNAGAASGTLTYQNTAMAWATNASGTCTLWGWSSMRYIFRDTTATNALFDSVRYGWGATDTVATVNTTASGLIAQIQTDGTYIDFSDSSAVSATSYQYATRATRLENIPETSVNLYLFITAKNLTSAPATATTLTMGMVSVEIVGNTKVELTGATGSGAARSIPVQIQGGSATISGATAHSSPTTLNPAPVGGRVVPTTTATVDTSLIAADTSWAPYTTSNQGIIKAFGTAELDWAANVSFTPTAWASATTPTVLRPASGTASVRTYLTGLQLQSDALGGATNAWIIDGAIAVTSVTIATPGVFTNSGTNDLKVGDAIIFGALGTITGISINTVYYVTATSLAATTFTLATTIGGTAVQITGSTAAVTAYRVLSAVRLQTAALAPTTITFANPIRTNANVALALLSSSTQTGTIYAQAQGYYGF